MKNKNSFILALILVCVFAIGVFIFAGGIKGMSAYELAVLNGYVGTEQEWLAGLQGSDGKDGESIDYAAMYEDYKESDEYVEVSDVVLMNDQPSKITDAILISRKTMGIIKQNVLFILISKFLVMTLTLFGVSGMWLAIFADVGVCLLTILNTLRIIKKH